MKKSLLTLKYLVLIIFVLVSIFPYYWMIITSLCEHEWIGNPTIFPIPPYLGCFKNALFDYPFLRWTLNTFIISISGTLGCLFFASLAAFSFSCLQWKFRDLIFYVLLSTLFLPAFLMVIPQFLFIAEIGWMDTYWGIFIPSWFSMITVFLLRQYFFSIPNEILNAARIDGANLWQIYWKLVIPNSKIVLMTLFVFNFVGQWNSFLWPLLVTQSNKMDVLAVGMASFGGDFNITYNQIMAGSILSLAPILLMFIFLSKYVSKGLEMRIT